MPNGPGRLPWFIQPSLRIGAVDDPLEHEADRVADRVTRAGSASLQRSCSCEGSGAPCEHCAEQDTLPTVGTMQRSPTGDQDSDATAPQITIDAATRPGHSIDPNVRETLEPRFGVSFENVRVHDDAVAAAAAESVGARAYTIGSDVVFGAGEYAPNTASGQRTLAHELTHVVQQRPAAIQHIQRDLATPPPTVAPAAQADLTQEQIASAIAFNRAHFDGADTRLIQSLLAGPITGDWTEDNIIAIASTQEEYGLAKDGKVGHETFTFLNREQRLEGADTSTAACLTSFEIQVRGPNFQRVNATRCSFDNQLAMNAEFSERCNCAQFQYRQFIRGHLRRTRAGAVTDLGNIFAGEIANRDPATGAVVPGLPTNFAEDADTNDPVPNYGHREMPPGAIAEDHYVNATGADDQPHGCRYRGTDGPGATINDCQPGDSYDVEMNFRGEIQRNGVPIQTKLWGAFHRPDWRP